MIRKRKKQLILASLATLLPIAYGLLLWDHLPPQMATHYGLDGQADGWSSRGFAVWFIPLCMLLTLWLCVLITAKDPKNKDQNPKPMTMVIWIIPAITNLCSGLMYALSLGVDVSVFAVMQAAMGLMFVVIGNYLPKCRPNHTIGIRVPWTLSDEENWEASHRFGGRVWFIGGMILMLTAWLPAEAGGALMFAVILLLAFIPIGYSYWFYRKKRRVGAIGKAALSRGSKRVGLISLTALVVILALCAVLLLTGDLQFHLGADALTIEASYYEDVSIPYDSVTALEYREGTPDGFRAWGFGSFRLEMGLFENQELGLHTRYTYYRPASYILLTVNGSPWILSAETPAQTRQLYQDLSRRVSP